MKKIIDTGEAPAAVGAYSQAVKAGDLIFTSGQLPIDPETGEFSDDVKEQAAQSMKNIGAILKAEGRRLCGHCQNNCTAGGYCGFRGSQ